MVDEITAVGDAVFRRKCLEVFEQRLENSNVVMVSHSPKTIKEFCTSAAILENGQLQYFPDVDDGLAVFQKMMAA